jgi:hypothetical protein
LNFRFLYAIKPAVKLTGLSQAITNASFLPVCKSCQCQVVTVGQPISNETNFVASISPFISLIGILRVASELVHIVCPCSRTRYRENNGSDIGIHLQHCRAGGISSPEGKIHPLPPGHYADMVPAVGTTRTGFDFRICCQRT